MENLVIPVTEIEIHGITKAEDFIKLLRKKNQKLDDMMKDTCYLQDGEFLLI